MFLGAIQKTLGIVEKKTTMPILNNLLIRTEKNRIKIMATDREIGLVADYEAQILREGDITLSAKKLHEMVREIQGETIHVAKNERDMVTLTCNKVIYRIPGLPAEDYPAVVDSEEIPLFKIKATLLKEMIRKTMFAMSADEMRKNLNGVFLETEKLGDNYGIADGGDGWPSSFPDERLIRGRKNFSLWKKGSLSQKGVDGDPEVVEDACRARCRWGSAGDV